MPSNPPRCLFSGEEALICFSRIVVLLDFQECRLIKAIQSLLVIELGRQFQESLVAELASRQYVVTAVETAEQALPVRVLELPDLANIRQVPVSLGVVNTISYNEFIRNLETDPACFYFNFPP